MTATTAVQADHRGLLLQAYAAYNSQGVEGLVALVSDDVNWPDDDAAEAPPNSMRLKGELRMADANPRGCLRRLIAATRTGLQGPMGARQH